MRWLVPIVLVGCSPARAPAPQGPIELFEVHGKPLMVSSWTRSVAEGTRYSLVDEGGYIVDVVADGRDPSECDHCPSHRALAHPLGKGRTSRGSAVALGPTNAPLSSARVLSHRDVSDWWNPAKPPKQWTEDLTIDVDGDGKADLIREAKGPQLTYRVRRWEKGTWQVVGEWMTPFVLDEEDAQSLAATSP
ncbi:MAG: hypothetical protein ACXWUG_10745 [Polyangiales bacterium]